ncbi:MAG: M23/M56 family metallopeptidase [Bacteroidota bacterium]
MIFYYALISLGILIFWLYYLLVLKRSTHYAINRWFLLLGLFLSFLAPSALKIAPSTAIQVNQLAQPVKTSTVAIARPVIEPIVSFTQKAEKNLGNWLITIYLAGVIIFSARILFGIYYASHLLYGKPRTIGNTRIYQSQMKQPFSFFNGIFIPKSWNWKIPQEILIHEKEHINNYHVIDLILAELATIVLWFNPIVHYYKRSVRLNLEYLADQAVLDSGYEVTSYQTLLLQLSLQDTDQIPLIMTFTTPLKNRIQMMNKSNSKPWMKLAFLGAIPLAGILMALNTSEKLQRPVRSVLAPINMLVNDGDNIPEGLPINRNQLTRLSSHFGKRIHPITEEEVFHQGVDLVAKIGTPVYATAEGYVELASYDEKHGYFVRIKHSDEYQTQYSHLKNFIVMQSGFITKGQIIGYVGNTGVSMAPHLHYEIHKNGKPADPKEYLNLDDC